MSTITKQAVQAVADLKAGYTLGHADVAILNELARIALASLEAEAVCVIDQSNLDYLKSGADADVWPASRKEMGDVLLYRTAPPAPAKAEPVAWLWSHRKHPSEVTLVRPEDDEKAEGAHWSGWSCQALYAAPPAPVSVPDFPEILPCPVILEPGLRFGKGVPTKAMLGALQRRAEHYAELEAMTPEQRAKHDAGMKEFAAMLQGADRPQNETQNIPENIPATQFKPVADLYGLTSPTGSETSFTFDAVEARDFIGGGWSCQEYVELERFQEAVSGNSPVIPDGWQLVPKKITLEMECALSRADSYEIGWRWALAAAPTHSGTNDGWVACSERMPGMGVDVLACTISPIGGFEEIETAQWHGGMKGEQPVFITSADAIEPTHWMPLPAAPLQEVK